MADAVFDGRPRFHLDCHRILPFHFSFWVLETLYALYVIFWRSALIIYYSRHFFEFSPHLLATSGLFTHFLFDMFWFLMIHMPCLTYMADSAPRFWRLSAISSIIFEDFLFSTFWLYIIDMHATMLSISLTTSAWRSFHYGYFLMFITRTYITQSLTTKAMTVWFLLQMMMIFYTRHVKNFSPQHAAVTNIAIWGGYLLYVYWGK